MICVFGLGFVGLTTALGFAHRGQTVYGIDPDAGKTACLARGDLPFLEKDMDEVLRQQLGSRFFLANDLSLAVKNSRFLFFCVGTPYGAGGEADLSQLFSALQAALEAMDDDVQRILVIKSTVPPSTTEEKILPFVARFGKNVLLANNPEFLREGFCWEDFIHADRIVLGVHEAEAGEKLAALYAPFARPVVTVSRTTAEFIKYLSNTLLATLISYSNEMSLVADAIGGIDVAAAFKILHMDARWGGCSMTSYAYPGCGYGGYCLPKDTNALYAQATQKGFVPDILGHVIKTNAQMPAHTAARIVKDLPPSSKIGILGLSFKPGSDDVRDTPAAKIIQEILMMGYSNVTAYDPVATAEYRRHYDQPIHYAARVEELYESCDVLAIVTAWPEFQAAWDTGKPVIDCRYMRPVGLTAPDPQ